MLLDIISLACGFHFGWYLQVWWSHYEICIINISATAVITLTTHYIFLLKHWFIISEENWFWLIIWTLIFYIHHDNFIYIYHTISVHIPPYSFWQTEERRDKTVKQLKEDLAATQERLASNDKQNFWESPNFKLVVSISILVLAIFAKR